MTLQERILALIKEEIDKDPEHIGYAGKTDDEIKVLLNQNVVKQVVTDVVSAPRISTILAGVPFTPNVILEKDVADAKSAKSIDELGVI